MAENIISAIDIGSSNIATVVGFYNSETKELRVIGFNSALSRGVKKGLIVDIEKVSSAVEESVEKAERMAGQKISEVLVSISGPHISSLNSHGIVAISGSNNEIVEEDVERVIEAARAISLSTTRQIIEVSPREYSVNGQSGINNPVGMSGVRLEVDTHIITASTTNLRNIDRVLEDLGIENTGYAFCGVASAESTLTDTEKDLGVAVVDVGGGKIDICMYVEGALSYSACIPIGARHITNDIAVGLRISLESAERIKLYLSKNSDKILAELKKRQPERLDFKSLMLPEDIEDISAKEVVNGIINPRLEEICNLIGEEIEKSGFAKQIPAGIVLTGGGSRTIAMTHICRKMLGLPIRVGLPAQITGLIDEITDPQFSTTVGLLQYAVKYAETENSSMKNFNKVLKDFSMSSIVQQIKSFFKQFLP